jgi:hypothetical protein
MHEAEEASTVSAPPAATKGPKRPDFTADPKYQRLVSVMAVQSVTALNDLQISDFRNKAAELWNQQPDAVRKQPGSFKSWGDLVKTLFTFADAPSPAKPDAGAATAGAADDGCAPAAGEAAGGPEDIDGAVADSVQVVQALLAGQEAALDIVLDEAKLQAYTKALYAHADQLDAAVRGKFEELADSESTVEDVVKMVEVPFRVSHLARTSLAPLSPIPCGHNRWHPIVSPSWWHPVGGRCCALLTPRISLAPVHLRHLMVRASRTMPSKLGLDSPRSSPPLKHMR